MTRLEAIAKTNSIIENITINEVNDIIDGDAINIVQLLNDYIFNELLVSGWYYNNEATLFCSDVLLQHLLTMYVKQFN